MNRTTTAMAAGLAGMLGLATPAMAGDFSLNLGIGVGRHGTQVGLGIGTGHARPAVVQPAYRVVTERVWVPVVETRYRDVPVVDGCGRVIAYRREAYTVEGGYWKQVKRRVRVEPAHRIPVVASGRATRPHATVGRTIRPSAVGAVRAAAISGALRGRTGSMRSMGIR